MEESRTLIYDGSFNGFLTAVFTGFEEKSNYLNIKKKSVNSTNLFENTNIIFTDMHKAERVWNTIQSKNNAAIKTIYFSFLSQKKNIENLLYIYIKNLFNPYLAAQIGFSINTQIKLEDKAKSVSNEKKYLEKSIEFTPSMDGIYFTNITPENDILPLLSKYFRIKHKNQPWLIFDAKRNYGIYYNLFNVEIVSINIKHINNVLINTDNNPVSRKNKKIAKLNNHFKLSSLKELVISKINNTMYLNTLNINEAKRAVV